MQYRYSDRARQGHITIQDGNRTVSITMSELQVEDSGIYSCVYSSNYVLLKTVSLNVYKGEYCFFPHINSHPSEDNSAAAPLHPPAFPRPPQPPASTLTHRLPHSQRLLSRSPTEPQPWGHPALPCPQPPAPADGCPSPAASSGREQDALMPSTRAQPSMCSLQNYTGRSWMVCLCSAHTGPWATAGEEKPGANNEVRLSAHS